ncbi:MAG: 30S ribosome-binding factor RbfA [Nitrospinae bacterium]|nr:30S ribosome-binding factor RbfA [Nitrospinota bacterium]
MQFKRSERVSELMREEISSILMRELKDPRIGFITLTRIELSQDLRNAKIFVSIMGGEDEKKNTMKGLESASGFIKWELRKRLRLKIIPEIIFKIDTSIEHSDKISRILGELKDELEGYKP